MSEALSREQLALEFYNARRRRFGMPPVKVEAITLHAASSPLIVDALAAADAILQRHVIPPLEAVAIAHDGFRGDVVGRYVTREGKSGVVVQQHGMRVVHVYSDKWLLQPNGETAAP